jgi:hypothetical protein
MGRMPLVKQQCAPGHQIVPIADESTQSRQIWFIQRGVAQLGVVQFGESGQKVDVDPVALAAPKPALAAGSDLRGVDVGDGQRSGEQRTARSGRW